MDELQALRALRDEHDAPGSEIGLARARHQLLDRIAEADRHRAPTACRSTGRRAALLVAVVAAACAVVVGIVPLGTDHRGAQAAAAEVLRSASRPVHALQPTTLRPGEYLRQRTVQITWGSAGDAHRDVLDGSDGKPVVWATKRVVEVWIPYDPSDEWVVRERVVPFGFASKDAVGLAAQPEDATWKARRGVFGSHWTYPHPRQYAATYRHYPRDPHELLGYVRRHASGSGPADARAFNEIGDLLRSQAVPADLRSSLYEALALIPHVTLAQRTANLAGRTGVAIEYPGEGQLLFDPGTGAFIGERMVSPDFPAVPGLGPDKATFSTAVTATVVDRAPLDTARVPPGRS